MGEKLAFYFFVIDGTSRHWNGGRQLLINVWNSNMKKDKISSEWNPSRWPVEVSTRLPLSFQGIQPYATHDISNEAQFPVYLSAPSPPPPPPPRLPALFFSPSNLTRWHLISRWVEDHSPHRPCRVADLFWLGHSSAIRVATLLPLYTHAALGTHEGDNNVMLKLAKWKSGNGLTAGFSSFFFKS